MRRPQDAPAKLAGFTLLGTIGGDTYLAVNVEPAPRPWFSGPFPYHQPPRGFDEQKFLDRTELQPGHTFTERGRS